MVQVLTRGLYTISTALLVPAIVALLVVLGVTLVLAGGFVREALTRRKVRASLQDALLIAGRPGSSAVAIRATLARAGAGLPFRFAARLPPGPCTTRLLEKHLDDVEADAAAATGRLTFLTRIGPMLGLMGTLIPLGPALAELASGNVAGLTQNLIVVFSMTVLGLLVSGLAYGMGVVRRLWYGRDISDLEFLADRLVDVAEVRDAAA